MLVMRTSACGNAARTGSAGVREFRSASGNVYVQNKALSNFLDKQGFKLDIGLNEACAKYHFTARCPRTVVGGETFFNPNLGDPGDLPTGVGFTEGDYKNNKLVELDKCFIFDRKPFDADAVQKAFEKKYGIVLPEAYIIYHGRYVYFWIRIVQGISRWDPTSLMLILRDNTDEEVSITRRANRERSRTERIKKQF